MKPISHDPLDELIAAALHGEITPAERAQLDTRLANDPAARAAYQEAQLMHDLLEKTHTAAQPDPGFEQRMVSGVRRKMTDAQRPRESAWQSVVALWTTLNNIFGKARFWQYGVACMAVFVVAFSILISLGNNVKSVFTTISSQLSAAQTAGYPDDWAQKSANSTFAAQQAVDQAQARHNQAQTTINVGNAILRASPVQTAPAAAPYTWHSQAINNTTASWNNGNGAASSTGGGTLVVDGSAVPAPQNAPVVVNADAASAVPAAPSAAAAPPSGQAMDRKWNEIPSEADTTGLPANQQLDQLQVQAADLKKQIDASDSGVVTAPLSKEEAAAKQAQTDQLQAQLKTVQAQISTLTSNTAAQPAPGVVDTRKLIRNAQLDLEVKSFQDTMDRITALTRAAGGYVDSDNSQRGGNGKIQGTVVVKVLPQTLEGFLFQLRDLGELKNQTISTQDVTKDYVDTQARIDNSLRMEAQLQELLKRDYGKISELLEVERELARVRGEIEQMQGQLKVYDFEVAYATVTMNIQEKDLNQAAAYLLKEQDNFSLVSTDVENAFQQARHAADDFKAQVLNANLNHNTGSDVTATLDVMVPPDQIEPFLAQIRTLGRVDNFTRQSQRVANDGGESTQPADQTLTQKDKVEVQISIATDNESRKQVALTVVATTVSDALDKAKSAALAQAGTEILSSSLNQAPQGQATAQLSVRVPGKSYQALLDAFRALGRQASFSLQRDDNPGPGASGDDEPVVVNLSLTDDDAPLQQTQLSIRGDDVDSQAQQLKQDAATAGAEIKASSFEHQPDGTETAQMSFRIPMAKYPAFMDTLKKLGKVESLTVNRNDRPDETRADGTAPAQIDLTLHNERDIVAEDDGLWPTLRRTFGEGADALFGSIRVIGVGVAFIVPWLIALAIVAWIGRRIYVRYKK